MIGALVPDLSHPNFAASITADDERRHVTCTLSGELDLGSADELLGAVDGLRDADDVVIDLDALSFMDSTGVHALLACRDVLADRGIPTQLEHVNPQALRVLELTGTRELLLIRSGGGE